MHCTIDKILSIKTFVRVVLAFRYDLCGLLGCGEAGVFLRALWGRFVLSGQSSACVPPVGASVVSYDRASACDIKYRVS